MKKGDKVCFHGENLFFTVMAQSKRFAILSRKLDKKEDEDILQDLAELMYYANLDVAFEKNKDEPIYTIIDFKEGVRGPDNLSLRATDYFSEDDCAEALKSLHSGELGISRRHRIPFSMADIAEINEP